MTKENSSGAEKFQALYLITPSHTPKPVSCGWGNTWGGLSIPSLCPERAEKRNRRDPSYDAGPVSTSQNPQTRGLVSHTRELRCAGPQAA